jgi:hypothetical protein
MLVGEDQVCLKEAEPVLFHLGIEAVAGFAVRPACLKRFLGGLAQISYGGDTNASLYSGCLQGAEACLSFALQQTLRVIFIEA